MPAQAVTADRLTAHTTVVLDQQRLLRVVPQVRPLPVQNVHPEPGQQNVLVVTANVAAVVAIVVAQ